MARPWRNARTLVTIIDQGRSAVSSVPRRLWGTIGDEKHRSRKSDHNPWLQRGRYGVVTAVDIPHQPAKGLDCTSVAASLVKHRDRRVKYVIWNRRILSYKRISRTPGWAWRPYKGPNPHTHHLHLSVRPEYCDDTKPWQIDWSWTVGERIMRTGVSGPDVAELQRLLKITVDGDFGPLTEQAVRAFQGSAGLKVDGEAGPKTLAALRDRAKAEAKPAPAPQPAPNPAPVPAPAPVPMPRPGEPVEDFADYLRTLEKRLAEVESKLGS